MKHRVAIPRAFKSAQAATVAASSAPSSLQSHASDMSPHGCAGVKVSRHQGCTAVERVKFHSGFQLGGGQGCPFVAQLGAAGGPPGTQPEVLFAEVWSQLPQAAGWKTPS